MAPTTQPAIIFDFGGVIMDWNAHYLYDTLLESPAAVDEFFTEIGFWPWNLELDRGLPYAQGVAELSSHFPQHATLIRAFDERWEETVRGTLPHSVMILNTLKARGYPLFGLTNWSAEKFELTRRKYPIFHVFEDIVVSGIVKLVKPDPRIYRLLLEKIGRSAEECIFIDDSEKNSLAARELGFRAIRFTSPEQLQAELTQMEIL
jgi:2-haloacid dehalogenase